LIYSRRRVVTGTLLSPSTGCAISYLHTKRRVQTVDIPILVPGFAPPRLRYIIAQRTVTKSYSSLTIEVFVMSHRVFCKCLPTSHIPRRVIIFGLFYCEDRGTKLLRNICNYQSTLPNIPEDLNFHKFRCVNLKSRNTLFIPPQFIIF